MSELQILFAIFVVLYLLQCVAWVPQDSAAFRATFFSGWKQELGGFRLGAARTRGVLGNPLPPLNGVAVCQPTLAAVSPFGVARAAGGAAGYVAFEGMGTVSAAGKQVRIAGTAFLAASSPSEAARLAAWIEKLRAMPERKRPQAIGKQLAASLDFEKAAERIAEYERRTRILGWAATALFAYLFLFLPLIIDAVGLARVWPGLVAALVVMVAVIGWDFRRAHRELFPEESDARWTALVTILLSPVAAIRAKDVVMRDLFAAYHPLVAARALCPPAEFRRAAERTLREITFPLASSAAEEDGAGVKCEAWFRELLSAAVRGAIARAEIKPDDLLAPPKRSSAQCVSYCPRCCQQYAVMPGDCKDCGGIALEALSEK